MNWQKNRIARKLSFGIGLSLVVAQNPFVLDSTLSSALPQSIANTIQVADVDNDGIQDIILSGYDQSRFGVFLDIINGSSDDSLLILGSQMYIITFTDTIAMEIGGIGNIDLADVNQDGYIDAYLTGSAQSNLYYNTDGIFSQSSGLESMFLSYSNGQWGDVNMDGAPDLFIMGADNRNDIIVNELYINNGSNLDEDKTTIFPALFNGSSAWGDYDNDGDPDLIICGQTADKTASVSRFYQNDPIGRLTELTTADEVGGLKAGAFLFTDLDSDGDLDIIMSGWNKIQGKLVTWILRNEPLGTFSLIDNQIDFGVAYGTIDAVDFNLDGLKDFVISGVDSVTEHATKVHSLSAQVFVNNGNGTFSSILEVPGARTVKFMDVNHDAIPDLIANGTTEIGNDSLTFSHIYLNSTVGTNLAPAAPTALTAFAVSTRAIFTWGAGSDDIDDPASLSYNIRIGTEPGENDLMSSAVPYNKTSVGQLLIREFNEIPHGNYYWAVQAVDASGTKSEWSSEETFFIARLVSSTQSFPGVYFSTGGWADYNEDEFLDFGLTGVTFSGGSITTLFDNRDGLLSQDLTQDIEAVFGGHVSWVDYTNDGHLDMSLSGFQIINFAPWRVTKFYTYENGIYIPDIDSEIYMDANFDNIPDYWVTGGANGHHWGDYDNDGDLDFVQGGFDNYNIRHLDIFYNDNGTLRLDTNQTNLVPVYPAMVQWVDLNRDGYLDLVTIGADETETLGMRVFLNNSNFVLSEGVTWNSEIYGVTAGAIAFADYNSDGYDDFAITGKNSSNQLISYVVTNAINQFTILGEHILEGVYFGRPAWGDYDSDGDLDLLVTGQSSPIGGLGSDPVTTLYIQDEEGNFAPDETLSIDSVGISFAQWGDYDVDGDLDLFLAGFKANQDVVAQVYDNLESLENKNKAPNAPYGLDDSDINDDKVTLTWTAPVDPENPKGGYTPELGLRYQLQIGSENESNLHSISTGHYGVDGIGTIKQIKDGISWALQKIVQDIPEGNYGWRVRAVDHGNTTSDWSSTDYFYIDITAPTVDTIRANYVSDEQIILIVKFKEDFYLDLNIDPQILVTHPDNPDLNEDGLNDTLVVEKQSFNGDEWTGVLILPDTYSGKAIQVQVSDAQDDRKNIMEKVSIFKSPETIISSLGGTAISEDGQTTILIPQNAVSSDISLTIIGQGVSPTLSDSTFLISDLYDISPSDLSLNKPGILRIAFKDSAIVDSGATPFIARVLSNEILELGGSRITINSNPYLQVQIDSMGTFGIFTTRDTLTLDSLNVETVVCQPRIFSPAGSVFEFTQTNIMYDLETPDDVTARIFNLSGRLKRTIKPEIAGQSGHQVLNWDGKDSKGNVVPSGLYIVTLEKSDTILRTTVGVLNR